jgi:molybdenum cofactor synthesis domain-containing protein
VRPFAHTILFSDALAIVLEAATPIDRRDRVATEDASGRVAARDIVASVDVPPFDRAAMDGYAVIASDTTGASREAPRSLVCVGELFAGQAPARRVGAGECLQLATGAVLPDGADAVVMVEDTSRGDGDRVSIHNTVVARQHVGPRGADLKSGQPIVTAGQLLSPSRVGAVAAAGVAMIDVYARPTVAILSTGNELANPGQPLAPGQIYNVNRYTLEAVVREHGGVPMAVPATADSIDAISRALEAARACDIIVLSGGSSVGDRDLIVDAIERLGDVKFHGIAVKPGKPTLFATIGRTPVFGMPGYPTSCLSNAYMLLLPFLRKTARLPPWSPRRIDLPLARKIVSATDRHQFYTVRISDGRAVPAFKASGDITSMAHADGYIEIPAQTSAVEAGTIVTVTLFQ